MEGKILEVKYRIAYFDTKGEVSALLDEEVNELHELSVSLHSMARVQTSINWQNARLNWLQEGDANSKFFHGVMSNRRRRNTVNLVNVNGINIEGVQNIRTAVYDHFSSHFKVVGAIRPGVEGLSFRKLSCREAGTLIKPFSLE
jgi:ribosome recycling factor